MRRKRKWVPCLSEDGHDLISARLVLRPLRADDGETLRGTLDDEVRRWQGYDDAAVEAIVASVPSWTATRFIACPLHFVVHEVGDDKAAGVYSLYLDPDDPEVLTIGWWLKDGFRGRGLGRESLTLVLSYVHDHLHQPIARMGTTDDNVRARAQIEATGGYVAFHERRTLPDGREVAAVWYEHER